MLVRVCACVWLSLCVCLVWSGVQLVCGWRVFVRVEEGMAWLKAVATDVPAGRRAEAAAPSVPTRIGKGLVRRECLTLSS